jgi:hypothetical protein
MNTNNFRFLRRPVTAFVVVAAMVFGALTGVGFSYASTPHATVVKYVTKLPALVWHPLTLLNGATSLAADGTGAPAYAVSSQGVVYLTGSLKVVSTSLPAFVMPANARPGAWDCFSIFSNDASLTQSPGVIHIHVNGDANIEGAGATFFNSIVGVTYVKGH